MIESQPVNAAIRHDLRELCVQLVEHALGAAFRASSAPIAEDRETTPEPLITLNERFCAVRLLRVSRLITDTRDWGEVQSQ